MFAVSAPHSLPLEGKGQDTEGEVGGGVRQRSSWRCYMLLLWEKQTNKHLPTPCKGHHGRMENWISIIDYGICANLMPLSSLEGTQTLLNVHLFTGLETYIQRWYRKQTFIYLFFKKSLFHVNFLFSWKDFYVIPFQEFMLKFLLPAE